MIPILYQDAHMVVCVKPVGVISQDAGEESLPLRLKQQLGLKELSVVHRLDREVGGVMVLAASQKAAAALSRSVQERTLEKRYFAVVEGSAPSEGMLEDLLFHDRQRNKTYVVDRLRKGVKDARLEFWRRQERNGHTLVEILLHTGRTHQIRVQFASRKLPLTGDRRYGGKGERLGLWSWKLTLKHPVTGKEMTFSQLPPSELPWSQFSFEDGNGGDSFCIE